STDSGYPMEDPAPVRLSFPPFDLDEANARLSHEGKVVPLPPRALAVLCARVSGGRSPVRRGEPCPRADANTSRNEAQPAGVPRSALAPRRITVVIVVR